MMLALETRNVEIGARWRAQLMEELEGLYRRYSDSIAGGRLEILGPVHRRTSKCEVRLVLAGAGIRIVRHSELSQALIAQMLGEARRQLGPPRATTVRPPGFVFHGTVLGVRRDQRIGWIRPADPRAEFVRFDAAALEGDGFQRLEPGDPVSWWMEKGAKGRIHLVA